MTHLALNCPRCRKRLEYVPLDGLTLYYRCAEHGAIILRPLLIVESDEEFMASASPDEGRLRSSDAA